MSTRRTVTVQPRNAALSDVLRLGATSGKGDGKRRNLIGLAIQGTDVTVKRGSDVNNAVVEAVAKSMRDINKVSLLLEDYGGHDSKRLQMWIRNLPNARDRVRSFAYYQVEKVRVKLPSNGGPLQTPYVDIFVLMGDAADEPFGFQQGQVQRYFIRKYVKDASNRDVLPVVRHVDAMGREHAMAGRFWT